VANCVHFSKPQVAEVTDLRGQPKPARIQSQLPVLGLSEVPPSAEDVHGDVLVWTEDLFVLDVLIELVEAGRSCLLLLLLFLLTLLIIRESCDTTILNCSLGKGVYEVLKLDLIQNAFLCQNKWGHAGTCCIT